MNLTLEGMTDELCKTISKFPDSRTGKNKSYTIEDVGLAAFSVFFTQEPSFLSYQRMMQQTKGRNNATSLFGITDIPTDPQIRTILDPVGPEYLFELFDRYLWLLGDQGILDQFRAANGDLLVALDGTWSVSSNTIHCRECSTATHEGVITYYHSMITPVIVAPGKSHVIPLSPEYITPQDGKDKQDCENTAVKRWIAVCGKRYAPLKITILGDDLYSRQPIMQTLLKAGLHYLLVCKRESHKWLYDWIDTLDKGGDLPQVVVRRWNGKYHEIDTYRFANDVPIKDDDETLKTGWCELTTIREEDGRRLYHNAFVSDRIVTREDVVDIVKWGRTRWKVENESNNTLKTKGYHLEHNYGHGKKHLANLLSTFTLLAFLFHTILDLSHELYRKLRSMLPSRITFFNDLRALTKYWYFSGFDEMLAFMIRGLKERIPAPG
jgi:hypothetical protein